MTQSQENILETSQGITKIAVSGYKSIAEECAIEISPLTILAGVNSSGKSSIIQPLLLMKQTLEAPYDPGSLLLYGANVKLTSLDQVFSKIDYQNYDEFSVEIEVDNFGSIRSIFNRDSGLIHIKETKYIEKNKLEMIIKAEMNQEEMIDEIIKQYSTFKKEILRKINCLIIHDRCFLEISLDLLNSPPEIEVKISGVVGERLEIHNKLEFYSLKYFIKKYINNTIHVPGIRGNPERTYSVTAVGEQFSGTFENYVASVINDWQAQNSPKLAELERYLSILGLTNQIRAKKINDVQVELEVSRLPCNSSSNGNKTDMVSIADVGFGVSQTLPAIVALLVAKPHQLVYLEQPEIHLHPRAQAAFADILVESANRGVKVVVETHSDLILKRVQTLVAEDKIEPDKIKLHWFNRDQNGCTKVTTADLDEAGTFGDWPEDFSEVDLQEESRYLDASELKMMGG